SSPSTCAPFEVGERLRCGRSSCVLPTSTARSRPRFPSTTVSGTLDEVARGFSVFEPLLQADGHRVTDLLRDGHSQLGLDGQLVRAVAQGHEGALEGLAVDGAADLHQAAGAEVLS